METPIITDTVEKNTGLIVPCIEEYPALICLALSYVLIGGLMAIATKVFWLLHIYFVVGLVMMAVGTIILGAFEFATVCIYQQESFLSSKILKLSNQNQIEGKMYKKKYWLMTIGSCLIILENFIDIGEGAFYATGLYEKIFLTTGWFIGLSPLFLLVGLICLVIYMNASKKMALLLIALGILSLIGSCGMTFIALDFYGQPLYLPYNFVKGDDFPSWPYYFVIFMGTPVVLVVPLSIVVIALGFHFLLEQRHNNTEKMADEEEMGNQAFTFVGFVLPILGFGFHVCYFALSILSNQGQSGPDPYGMKFLSLEVVISFACTGLLAIINKSKKTPPFQRSLLFLLSSCDLYLSVQMLTSQFGMYYEQVSKNSLFVKCIPNSIRCNGKLDMPKNMDYERVDGCFHNLEYNSDEMNCDTTRFIGLYVFNLAAGIIGFIMAAYFCIKLIWQAMKSKRRYLKSIL